MPFGLIFGALVFGILGGAVGLRWLVHPALEAKIGGVLLAALGAALALGLLMGRRWARWGGVAAGITAAALGLQHVAEQGGVLAHVILFASATAASLLVVPATGDPRRGSARGAAAASGRIGATGWTALGCLIALLAVGMTSGPGEPEPSADREGVLPASAIGKSIRWTDLGDGLERARREGKPVLATFVTDWCPYCSKMARDTWRSTSVAERMDAVVPVKVDAEGARATGGLTGREWAERFGVSGYPVQLLLDEEARVLSRYDGYQTPRELLAWLDRVLPERPGDDPAAALAGASF